MENEPQSAEQNQHKLRNFIVVIGGLVAAGFLGAEFLPWIMHIIDRVGEKIDHPPLRRGRETKSKTEA